PFTEEPSEVYRSPNSYAGLQWLEGELDALVSEYDRLRRLRRHWLVSWHGDDARLLAEDSVDAAYSRFGRPMTAVNEWGKEVVHVHGAGIFLGGPAPGAHGAVGYLDHMELGSLEAKRIWESVGTAYEVVLGLLAPDGGELLTRRETSREPPNYYARTADGET